MKHISSVHGIRRHICPECNNRFSEASKLHRHRFTSGCNPSRDYESDLTEEDSGDEEKENNNINNKKFRSMPEQQEETLEQEIQEIEELLETHDSSAESLLLPTPAMVSQSSKRIPKTDEEMFSELLDFIIQDDMFIATSPTEDVFLLVNNNGEQENLIDDLFDNDDDLFALL